MVCVLRHFSAELRFTIFGLGSLVWDLCLGSLVGDLWLCIFGLRSLIIDLWIEIFGVGSLAVDRWLVIFGFGILVRSTGLLRRGGALGASWGYLARSSEILAL